MTIDFPVSGFLETKNTPYPPELSVPFHSQQSFLLPGVNFCKNLATGSMICIPSVLRTPRALYVGSAALRFSVYFLRCSR